MRLLSSEVLTSAGRLKNWPQGPCLIGKKKLVLQVGKLVLGHWYYQLWHVCRMCLQPVLNVSCIMQWLMWSAAGGCIYRRVCGVWRFHL